MTEQRTLNVDFPPSVNGYYKTVVINNRPRRAVSKDGKQYKKLVGSYLINQEPMEGRLSVRVVLHAPNNRRQRYDVDNRLKALLDVLQECKVIVNDSQIDELTVIRGEVIEPRGKAIVEITRIDTEQAELF